MEPVTVLMNEHRSIERVLDALEQAADRLARGGGPRPGFFLDAVRFLSGYADQRHHHKEEDLLFPALVKAGLPRDGGPIAVMLVEHVRGRELVGTIREAATRLSAGQTDAAGGLVAAASEYVALLRDHIQKEDRVLFPLAGQLLSTSDARNLGAAFSEAMADEEIEESRERLGQLGEALAEEAALMAR